MEISGLKLFLVWGVILAQGFVGGQRVAPGVPPQQYQYDPNQPPQQQQFQQQQQGHPPPPQHVQHQQQQFQQPPPPGVPPHQQQQQFQQPPQHVQQGHAPPPPQQQGHHGPSHGHAAPMTGHVSGQPLLDASNVKNERQHIQEHMDLPIDTSQMSEQELQFHYFKMHDADNNNKLDGCELVKSLIHWHDEANHDHSTGAPVPQPKVFTDEELTNMIDPILKNDDKNGDGFIDYAEFSLAQAAAAQRAKSQ